jgi:hypothetical protein
MSHSDCNVYKYEVATQQFPFGRVDFIDTSKANDCAKRHLNNVYLLYHDTVCIAVYNEHPQKDIKTIEFFIKKYQSDTTRLSDFVKLDSSISLTIDRICLDKNDRNYYGTYVWWKNIEYSTLTIPFVKTKDELLTTWYKWTE